MLFYEFIIVENLLSMEIIYAFKMPWKLTSKTSIMSARNLISVNVLMNILPVLPMQRIFFFNFIY